MALLNTRSYNTSALCLIDIIHAGRDNPLLIDRQVQLIPLNIPRFLERKYKTYTGAF